MPVDQTIAKAIDAGIAGIAVLAIIAVLLLVLFLGAIIKIIIDQNNERRERERREDQREEDRRTERLQVVESWNRQTAAMEALKVSTDQSAEREKSLIIAVNAIQQSAATTVQERTVQAETWKGLLSEIQAMRADNAADRDETHTVVAELTKHTETHVTTALNKSLDEHKITQEKLDKLPDTLIDKLREVIKVYLEHLDNTVQNVKTHFLDEVMHAVREAMNKSVFDNSDTQPLPKLLVTTPTIADPGHTPPTGTKIAPFTEAIADGGTFMSSGTVAPAGAAL